MIKKKNLSEPITLVLQAMLQLLIQSSALTKAEQDLLGEEGTLWGGKTVRGWGEAAALCREGDGLIELSSEVLSLFLAVLCVDGF